jgi:hypothetical protein
MIHDPNFLVEVLLLLTEDLGSTGQAVSDSSHILECLKSNLNSPLQNIQVLSF